MTILLLAGSMWLWGADQPVLQAQARRISEGAFAAGNYKVAYEGFRKLGPLDLKERPGPRRRRHADRDFAAARTLIGRTDEIDEFREAVIEVHKGNWRLLEAGAAQTT